MAFNINNSQGNLVATVEDGTVNTSDTSISLVGNATPNFGEIMNGNFIHMLEHFAKESEPENVIEGQVWYDKANNRLQVYKSTGWAIIFDQDDEVPPASGGTTFPANPVVGELFWKSDSDQWYVYDTTGWFQLFPPPDESISRIQNDSGTEFVDTNLVLGEVTFGSNGSAALTLDQNQTSIKLPVTVQGNYIVNAVGQHFRQQYFDANQPSATLDNSNATVAWDLDTAQVAKVILNGNKTISAPTNMKNGGTYILIMQQNGTGGHTVTFDSTFKFPDGGTAPEISTDAFISTIISFISDGTSMYGMTAGSSSLPELTLLIGANTKDYNIRDELVSQLAWDTVTPFSVVVTVDASSVVGATSGVGPGMTTGSPYPPGMEINIVNNGFIVGYGGSGGDNGGGLNAGGEPGDDGGDAIELLFDVSIDNQGVIGGGGGGGGGANDSVANATSPGGSGGAGDDPGGPGGTGSSFGTLELGGAQPPSVDGGQGGAGGDLGQDGAAGVTSPFQPGGAGGNAVTTNSNALVWVNLGDVRGAIV